MAKTKKKLTPGKKRGKSSSSTRYLLIIAVAACAIGMGYVGKVLLYDRITPSPFYLYVSPGLSTDSIVARFEKHTTPDKARALHRLLWIQGYTPKTGAYRVDEVISLLRLSRNLTNGRQSPIRFTFNNIRTKQDFAERVGQQLMIPRDTLLARLNNPTYCQRMGFSCDNVIALFIPDTYEFYWTITPDDFITKMEREYRRFWNEKRQQKAQDIPLTPTEVTTLASIVEEETKAPQEMPVVAGLYLNRLKKGMLLQADPTVKFAVGDVTLKRIYYNHLKIDSPYNTYKYLGLPPGPIRIPSSTAIDAVLNYKQHNYLYMCAKPDFSGRHNFATTLNEHRINAIRYQRALTN